MQTFRHILDGLELSTGIAWTLSEIAEAKGRQALNRRQAPMLFDGLREQARIQSVESSNRIEGVTVAAERLVPLVEGRETPRDRPEEEISGYRQALDLVLNHSRDLAVTPQTLLRLHRLCVPSAGDAGQWKTVDNDIVELRPGQAPRIRFRCVPAEETPAAVDELCAHYRHTFSQRQIPAPVVVAAPGGATPANECSKTQIDVVMSVLLLWGHGGPRAAPAAPTRSPTARCRGRCQTGVPLC